MLQSRHSRLFAAACGTMSAAQKGVAPVQPPGTRRFADVGPPPPRRGGGRKARHVDDERQNAILLNRQLLFLSLAVEQMPEKGRTSLLVVAGGPIKEGAGHGERSGSSGCRRCQAGLQLINNALIAVSAAREQQNDPAIFMHPPPQQIQSSATAN